MRFNLILKGGLLACGLHAMLSNPTVDAAGIRTYASRMQGANTANANMMAVLEGNVDAMEQLVEAQEQIVQEEDEVASILELLQAMAALDALSMPTTSAPSTAAPSISNQPSSSMMPSSSPSTSNMPSVSTVPSSVPSLSSMPSEGESQVPTTVAAIDPDVTTAPTMDGGTALPTFGNGTSSGGGVAPVEPTSPPAETSFPSLAPSVSSLPSSAPSSAPSVSLMPTTSPSAAPSAMPSVAPSGMPSASPTLAKCGMTPEERAARILAILVTVTDPLFLSDPTTIQGQAADWLIEQDEYVVCPDDPKLVQRFALAVMYFATNGDDWLQCSANPMALDSCGFEDPFVGDKRFLSAVNECEWAGITCDQHMCVDQIEFGTFMRCVCIVIPTRMKIYSPLCFPPSTIDQRAQQLGWDHSY